MVAPQDEVGSPPEPQITALNLLPLRPQDSSLASGSDLRGPATQSVRPRSAELASCWSLERGHQVDCSCEEVRTCWTSSVFPELQPQARPQPQGGGGEGRRGIGVGCHAHPYWPFLSTCHLVSSLQQPSEEGTGSFLLYQWGNQGQRDEVPSPRLPTW